MLARALAILVGQPMRSIEGVGLADTSDHRTTA
jgi:hypothetical protein